MPTTALPNGTTTLVQTNTFAAGTYNSGIFSLAAGQSQLVVTAARNSWPSTGSDVVSMSVFISFDSGVTWPLLIGFTAAGGDIVNPWTHTVEPSSTVSMVLPQPTDPNRQLKATIEVFSPINTSVAVTVS